MAWECEKALLNLIWPVRLKRISRNAFWIGFQTTYECSSKRICKNWISCKYDRISIGFALKLDLGWQSERGWCFRWLLGVSMIFWVGVGEKIYSPMHRDSLFNDSESIINISESILSLFFSPRIWHVCTLETIATASLHRICAVRRVPIAGQCVLPPAVISAFYFRYAFISAVWNAVRIRCMKLA